MAQQTLDGIGRMHTPLCYPGGKSNARSVIMPHIKRRHLQNIIISPFLGGGSIEIEFLNAGACIVAADSFKPLIDFWQELKANGASLARRALKHHPMETREHFYEVRNRLKDGRSEDIASDFYVVNRCSFSGLTLSGGWSPNCNKKFSPAIIRRLAEMDLRRAEFLHADFTKSLAWASPSNFIFADPPYALDGPKNNLYGTAGSHHADFDHEGFAALMMAHRAAGGEFLITYNDCELVRRLYEGCRFVNVEWRYYMNKTRESNEVLVFSEKV